MIAFAALIATAPFADAFWDPRAIVLKANFDMVPIHARRKT